MPQTETIHFHQPSLFAGLTGKIDKEECVIHGVSLIKLGVEAEGHGLWVDDTTGKQLVEFAKEKKKTPVNMDHGSGITSMNGYITNARIEMGRPRGDWHLLKTHEDTPTMLERAEQMPECFGLSAAFKGDPKGVTVEGKQCARVEKLLSFDIVVRPAANDGLFSAKDTPTSADYKTAIIALANPQSVDTAKLNVVTKQLLFDMPNAPQNTEPSLADVLAAVQGLTGRLEASEKQSQAIIDHINSQGQEQGEEAKIERQNQERFDILSKLNAMSDEELAAEGITRDQVDAEVNAYNESVGGQSQGNEGEQGAEGQQGNEGQMAGVGAEGAAGSAGAQFSALQRQVIALSNEIKAGRVREAKNAEAIEFEAVDKKIIGLAAQRDEAIELATKLVAENEALRLHVKTGTRPAPAGIEGGNILFSAMSTGDLHPWQQKVKQIELNQKVSAGKAIQLCDKEDGGALHQDYILSLQKDRSIHA